MRKYQPSSGSIEVHTLRIVMAERGLKRADLVRLTGHSPQRISNVLTGSDTSWPIRSRINQVLGARIFLKPKSEISPGALALPPVSSAVPNNRMIRSDQVTCRR